jgi:L-alanine-DL-glutamate epimerase-like enolase superfamily enzyme
MKVASACEAHYIDLMPHNPLGPLNTASIIHLAHADGGRAVILIMHDYLLACI